MALTALLEINTPSGDGDISCAIDPAFWSANRATIQGYAQDAGVTLWYQDSQPTGSIEAYVNTLADAKYQIDNAASLTETKGLGPVPAASSNSGLVVLAAGLSVVVVGSVAWLLTRRGR